MALAARLKRFGLSDHLIRRNPFFYRAATRALNKLETATPAQRKQWLERRRDEILGVARDTAYGIRIGGPRRFADWPILEKETLRSYPDDFVSGAARFTVGAATSGTSGTPLKLRRSLASIAYEQAVIDRCVARAGADPERCRGAVLRGDDIKPLADRAPPFWQPANGGRRLLFSSNHLSRATLKDFVGALRDYAPDVLFAYPTVLDSLCTLMLERGERLQIPLTVCSSEVLSHATAEQAARALGTRILDYYGQAERVAFASGNPIDGYRFEPSYSVNELRRVAADEHGAEYELIGTTLWNEALPLVRYRTGDRVRLALGDDPEAVARGEQTFLAIIGRSDDVLVAPAGTRLTGIDHIPRGVPGIVRAQFIQESPTSVRLLVIPAADYSERSRDLLLEHAALKLPPEMKVQIETTCELVRMPSGKAPLVIRNAW
jgi:phenylacetate-coenzyme A ligase PaaK-like adenylate-forming protein